MGAKRSLQEFFPGVGVEAMICDVQINLNRSKLLIGLGVNITTNLG